ncbi:MAG: response regulator transcription factor [Oligoflexus sp.]
MSRIILVEDDQRLGENIQFNLQLRGMQIEHALSLQAAKAVLAKQSFAACLLDIELPDGDGLSFCELLRAMYADMPILMITARHDERSAIAGLSMGADDYIRKPFGMKELAIRIEKLILKQRRQVPQAHLGGLILDLDHRRASYHQIDLQLARREFDLLRIFLNYPGRIYPRALLVESMSAEEVIQERTIDSHISHLRQKLKKAGCQELQIVSVYGSGYQLQWREE